MVQTVQPEKRNTLQLLLTHQWFVHRSSTSSFIRYLLASSGAEILFFAGMIDAPKYKCCQSCGLPWDKDPQGSGSNADGSKSNMYCSYCYKAGAFVNPNLTAEEMKAYATKKLEQYGIPGFLANLLTKDIPKLERWKQAE